MAIDTKLKRMSAVGSRRLPWMRRFTPSPDASVDQADRQHVALLYRGIAAGAAVQEQGIIGWLEYSVAGRGHYRVEGQLHYEVEGRLHFTPGNEDI